MFNEHGGINGRKINLISRDDGYSRGATLGPNYRSRGEPSVRRRVTISKIEEGPSQSLWLSRAPEAKFFATGGEAAACKPAV
jgi:hypothetical protein